MFCKVVMVGLTLAASSGIVGIVSVSDTFSAPLAPLIWPRFGPTTHAAIVFYIRCACIPTAAFPTESVSTSRSIFEKLVGFSSTLAFSALATKTLGAQKGRKL